MIDASTMPAPPFVEPDADIWLSDDELAAATEEELALLQAYWRKRLHAADPVAWGKDVLGEFWWSKQREIAYAVTKHRKVAVRSCHEAGKDFIAARVACHWIQTGTPNKRSVVTTAASGDQVKVILWKEINQAHKKGNLIGRTNLTEWYVDGEVVGIGRKVADYRPTSFQGIHSPEGVLIIYDEAVGVTEEIFQAGNSMAGNERSRQLAIGNPDNPDCYFAKLFRPESDWHQIHIDGDDTPNFSGEPVPETLKASLLDHSYVNSLIEEYGEDAPIVVSKVHGNFPQDNKDGVVPWSRLAGCKYTNVDNDGAHDLGVDVAASEEGDGDTTVIIERRGNEALGEWTVNSSDPEVVADKVVEVLQATGVTRVKVDSIGVGWGICGLLNAAKRLGKHDAKIIEVNVATRSANPGRFFNLRSQLWWEVARELSMRGAWNVERLSDKAMMDLIAPQYVVNTTGHIVVEAKGNTKKRLKRSPDRGDAVILAFYEPHPHSKGRSGGAQAAAMRLGV